METLERIMSNENMLKSYRVGQFSINAAQLNKLTNEIT